MGCLTEGESTVYRKDLSDLWTRPPGCAHELDYFKKHPEFKSHINRVENFKI